MNRPSLGERYGYPAVGFAAGIGWSFQFAPPIVRTVAVLLGVGAFAFTLLRGPDWLRKTYTWSRLQRFSRLGLCPSEPLSQRFYELVAQIAPVLFLALGFETRALRSWTGPLPIARPLTSRFA
jgi:hypothetical protein